MHQGALAAAGGTDHSTELPCLNGQVNTFEHQSLNRTGVVGFRYVTKFYHGEPVILRQPRSSQINANICKVERGDNPESRGTVVDFDLANLKSYV